ncbi:UDP-N-acetylmuramoyl-L-alanyl-D-glutamate--2,6-diaminopimelate ligase [Patescibacteria group bacterium]|nr:UDP-N-acetylmuramoyl-L-alanyl-D-glutamate--2,6-diaminopimelate ligase [Patescibacteria group bacterium]
MILSKLLSFCNVIKIFGSKNIEIRGITDNSNKVKKGFLFVGLKGQHFDSHKKIEEVIKKGAVCIVGQIKPQEKWYKNSTYIQVKDSRKILSTICSNWFGNPSTKLKVIGITGTDGKTTTSSMIYSILHAAGKKVGLVTSVAAKINGKDYDIGFHVTNPEAYQLQELLSKMVKNNCEYVVLEVTSHGIKQKRIFGINFDIAVLTNITPEHLDYHKTFKDYKNTKINFLLSSKNIVTNFTDKSFRDIKKNIKSQKLISYGLEEKADLYATNIKETKEGITFILHEASTKMQINPSFFGIYNVYNCLAAIAVSRQLNISDQTISQAIREFRLPEGRLEKINVKEDFDVFVDFAHTPNALEETLKILKGRTKGKLIVVFGCAGERDKTKRIKMGQIATKYSDFSIFTAEDPRSENVYKILSKQREGAMKNEVDEIKFGLDFDKHIFNSRSKYFAVVPERHEAIAFALLKIAKKKDIVVVLGKGHEKSMAYKNVEHPWSDQEIILKILSNGKDIAAIVFAAGKGTRMGSFTPKVLREIAGRPMISLTLENLRRSSFREIVVVVGYKKDQLIKETVGASKFAYQEKTLGTADAVARGLSKIGKNINTVVALNGDDSAFYRPQTIKKIINSYYDNKAVVSFVSLVKKNPKGLGRVVRNKKGELVSIIEEKEANPKQKQIKEVNDGLYVFNKRWLKENIGKVKKSTVGEYYIVDLIKLALKQNKKVNVFKLQNSDEWQGVNTEKQLKEANRKMLKRLSKWN